MLTLFPRRVEDINTRRGIPKDLAILTDDITLAANATICKVYCAIFDDIQRLDPLLSTSESCAIYRIVDEVCKKLLSRTLEEVRRRNNNHGWLNNQEQRLRGLQIRLNYHKTRTKDIKLLGATPIELLCRLVAVKSATPDWGIGKSLASLEGIILVQSSL